jgi:hypothetical protein
MTDRYHWRGCCGGLLLLAALAPAVYAADDAALEPAVVTSSAAQVAPAPASTVGPRAAPPVARPAAAPPAVSTARTQDRIELETTQISGNRELPKVMYVVPWRKPDLGDFSGRPPNSLLDEALAPVDRDVFRRQNRYYASLATQPGTPGSQPGAAVAAPAAPVAKDEK